MQCHHIQNQHDHRTSCVKNFVSSHFFHLIFKTNSNEHTVICFNTVQHQNHQPLSINYFLKMNTDTSSFKKVPDSIPLTNLRIRLQWNHTIIKPVPISDGAIKRYDARYP